MMQGCPPKNMHRNVWDIYLWKCRKCRRHSIFFLLRYFWNSRFDWSSLRIRQFEVWTFLKISKNSFRKFKPIIQSNPRRHKHELNNALYEAWNINLFEKNSVRQNEPSKTKFCNSLLSLKIRKKMPFGRTNPQKRNFVIRCCPWISEKQIRWAERTLKNVIL